MFKSKFKNLILVFLAFICLLPCLVLSAAAKSEELPHQPYPCYCDECVQLWNNEFNSIFSNDTFNSLAGSNTSLNGKHLLIFWRYRSSQSSYILDFYFFDSWTYDSFTLTLNNFICFTYDVSSVNDLVVNLSSISSDCDYSYSSQSVSFIFSFFDSYVLCESITGRPRIMLFYSDIVSDKLISDASVTDKYFNLICANFPYPEAPLSDTDIFKLTFPDYFFRWLSIVYDFVSQNKLVLLIFALGFFGAIIGIFKGTTRR